MCDYLNAQKWKITDSQRDGRINSISDEDKIIELLKKKYPIDVPPPRSWCDFSYDDGIFYPVNIKSTTGKGNDNLSCKMGIYYALTGKNPIEEQVSSIWKSYFDKLNADLSENDVDYYFLVLNKGTGKTFMSALKGLRSLVPNGNNLPFQCNWLENTPKDYKSRTFKEAKKFLLTNFAESIRGRIAIGDDFKANFPDYL